MLKLENISKKYQKNGFHLNLPRFEMTQPEIFALLGTSGCGKTTLLKCIAGLLPLDQGTIHWKKINITSLPAEQRGFSMVFQQPLLFPHMNLVENVSFGLRIKKKASHEIHQLTEKILYAVGLAGLEQRFPTELSGGQQQRASIARALITQPSLLLMDEPFNALDIGLRQDMRQLVSDLHVQHRVPILFVTHDQEEAFQLADRIAVMKNGQIIQTAQAQNLYEQPISIEVAQFLGIKNIISGKVEQDIFYAEEIKIPLSHPQTRFNHGWLILRPEIFQLHPLSEQYQKPLAEPFHTLHGEIRQNFYSQGVYHCRVLVGTHELEITCPKYSAWNPTIGEKVLLRFALSQVHFISKHP